MEVLRTGDADMEVYTRLSMAEWDRLAGGGMSARQAADFLYAGLPCRRFCDVLTQVYIGEDLRARLTEAFRAAGASLDSADRTARNWISGANVPNDRNTVFRVAFALGLSVEDTDRLLCAASDYGIHARDPVEAAYLFCLATGRGYANARCLAEKSAIDAVAVVAGSASQLMDEEVRVLVTEDDFRTWRRERAADFSKLHNTAYSFFMESLWHLLGEGEDFSLEYICDSALRFNDKIPLGRDRTRFNDLQKVLKRYWPNATAVKQMKERRIDVTRKILILLYILCEGVTDDDYRELEEDYVQPRERLETHAASINAMLKTCGMGPLDPRGQFDWLVLYCLCCDADETMGERMEQMLAWVFDRETSSTGAGTGGVS